MKGGTAGFDFACHAGDESGCEEIFHFDLKHNRHGEQSCDSRRQPSAPFVVADLPSGDSREQRKFCLLKRAVSVPGALATDVQGEPTFLLEVSVFLVVRGCLHRGMRIDRFSSKLIRKSVTCLGWLRVRMTTLVPLKIRGVASHAARAGDTRNHSLRLQITSPKAAGSKYNVTE